jgi:hypothetical protein
MGWQILVFYSEPEVYQLKKINYQCEIDIYSNPHYNTIIK